MGTQKAALCCAAVALILLFGTAAASKHGKAGSKGGGNKRSSGSGAREGGKSRTAEFEAHAAKQIKEVWCMRVNGVECFAALGARCVAVYQVAEGLASKKISEADAASILSTLAVSPHIGTAYAILKIAQKVRDYKSVSAVSPVVFPPGCVQTAHATHTHTHTHTHTRHTHMCIYVCTHTCTRANAHVYAHSRIDSHACVAGSWHFDRHAT